MISPNSSQRQARAPAAEGAPREIRAEDLLDGQRQVVIVHDDKRYRLVLTRNGKLILQK